MECCGGVEIFNYMHRVTTGMLWGIQDSSGSIWDMLGYLLDTRLLFLNNWIEPFVMGQLKNSKGLHDCHLDLSYDRR